MNGEQTREMPVEMTLGARLELDRLERRAVRLDRVVAELRSQARTYGDRPAVPLPLRQSMADFQRELDRIRERLTALSALGTGTGRTI